MRRVHANVKWATLIQGAPSFVAGPGPFNHQMGTSACRSHGKILPMQKCEIE